MKKLLTTALAVAVLAAPAMAQSPEKSISVSLMDQFQMVAGLGQSHIVETTATKTTGKTKGDVHFQNRRMRFGASASYGILEVSFVVAADKDLGQKTTVGIDTAEANLAFMDEIQLAMGRVGTRHKGASSSATLGTQSFLVGSGDQFDNNMGIKLHGTVANNIFEYALSVFHANQYGLSSGTQHGVYGPGVALQLRFNFLNETTGNKEYFLGKKSAVTLGFTFDYQMVSDNAKFYKWKGTERNQKNAMYFDVFLTGDVALGAITLPFMVVYQHIGLNPTQNDALTVPAGMQKSNYMGKFTYGIGIYVDSLKIMPAFKHSIEIHQINKDILKPGGLNHQLELSLGYFPYGDNLNLKIGYVYKGTKSITIADTKTITHDHQLITQVQMKI